ncbi:zinc finger, CCHC-type containing protein [Tanacetum coccineum]
MGDQNPIRTLGDYYKPSHEGYRNTIKLPKGNNVVPLRSDTIRLVQNGCSFHSLRFEDPNQHLKDFLKLVESLDLNGDNRERTRLLLFQYSLHDQASNWLEHLPAGSISTWEDLTTRFLAQFFSSRRTVKLRNDILMFQQHQEESLSEAWTHFKELLQKALNLRDKNADESWEIIENLTLYDHERWNDSKYFVKQHEEINTMQEIFILLRNTASRTPEKVITNRKRKGTHTKNVNSISLIRVEEEKNVGNNRAIDESLVEPSNYEEEKPLKEVDVTNEVERRMMTSRPKSG